MTTTMNRNAMMSYSASANCAEATFACENMSAFAIIMGAAIAALFFVILSVLVGIIAAIIIALALINILRLIIVKADKVQRT